MDDSKNNLQDSCFTQKRGWICCNAWYKLFVTFALLEYISEVGEEKVYNAIHTLQKLSPMDLSTDKIKLICERNTVAQETCSGDPKIIDISNENIKRINEIFGIQSTHYQKEAIL